MRNPGTVLHHLHYAADTALGMAIEDPVLLVVQAARRLPWPVRTRLADALARSASAPRAAVAAWIRGHDGEARRGIEGLVSGSSPVARGWRITLAEVGVLLNVPAAAGLGSRRTRARAAMRSGEVDEAVRLARGTSLGPRYASERAAMRAGVRLPVRTALARSTPAGPPRALHVLTNSRPHTESGYALRSHQVLLAQRSAGIGTLATTRVGYPLVVGRGIGHERDVVDGVAYDRLIPRASARTPGARLAQQLELLRPLATGFGPTVVQATTNYPNALVAQALAAELGRPWVYEVRGILEDTWVASFPPAQRVSAQASQRYRMLRAREAELARAADAVVVLSGTVENDLVARGVDPARVTVIPNGVAGSLLEVDVPAAAARQRLGLAPEGFWVGTVSSLVGYEGLDTLLRAVALARADGLDVRCAIVGDGVARPELDRLRDELGLGEAVVMPGRVAPESAQAWYLALDTFMVPRQDTSVTRAVTPLKHVTAMALGRPVIASDLPALAESLEGAGLLVKPEDAGDLAAAMTDLAGKPQVRDALAASGRAVAAARTWDEIGQRYRRLYEGLR